jgi:hypothetical protein
MNNSSFKTLSNSTQNSNINTFFCSSCGKQHAINEAKKFCDGCGSALTSPIIENTTTISYNTPNRGVLTITLASSNNQYDTKIFINEVFRFKENTLLGFSVKVPIEDSELRIKANVFFKDTYYVLKDLNIHKNYTMILKMNLFGVWYSDEFELISDTLSN